MIKIIFIIFILIIIYQINIRKIKGGHYIDRKIRDYTIFPIINRGLIGVHDLMHWIFDYGEVKQDNNTNNTLKNEVKNRLKANKLFNKILNNSFITNETRLAIKNRINKNKQIMKDIINDIL